MHYGFWQNDAADPSPAFDIADFDPDDIGRDWQHEAIPQIGSAAIDQLVANLGSPFANIAYTAADVLGLAGDKGAIKHLLPLVDHPDLLVRYKAVGALMQLGGRPLVERLLPPMLETVESRHAIVRALAAENLGHSADWRAVAPLVACLQGDWDQQVRAFAAAGLGEIGHVLSIEESATAHEAVVQIVAALIAGLRDDTPGVYTSVSDALAHIGAAAVAPLLRHLAEGCDPLEEGAARALVGTIRALGKIGASDAWEPLAALLDDADPTLRYHSAKALARLDAERAMDALVALVAGDPVADVRAHTIRVAERAALADPANQTIAAAIGTVARHGLADSDAAVRVQAVRLVAQLATADSALWQLPYGAVLLDCCADADAVVRATACAAFANPRFLALHHPNLPLPRLRERIGALLADPAPRTRVAAIAALAQVAPVAAPDELPVDAFIAALDDDSQIVCDAAAAALGQLAPCLAPAARERVTDRMIAHISDPTAGAFTRSHIVWALGQLGDARAVVHLVALFDDADWLLHEPVIHAILAIDAPQAIHELGRRVRADKPAGLRNAIGVALAQIKDPRTLPLLRRVLALLLEDEQMLRRDGTGPLGRDTHPDPLMPVHRTTSGEPFARHIIEEALHEMAAQPLG